MSSVLRKKIPRPIKRAVRRLLAEFPVRLHDAPADIVETLTLRVSRLPPARLRYRVAGTSDRDYFVRVGREVAEDIVRAIGSLVDVKAIKQVLDFGVGCGRVARHMSGLLPASNLTGVDVDQAAINWCQRHLSGTYLPILSTPSLPFADSRFDLSYAVSVFTHLPLHQQSAWLIELRRTLSPSGLLVITTLSPNLVYTRPDITESDVVSLRQTGFVYLAGTGPFNEGTAFQSRDYLRDAVPGMELIQHITHGVGKYQDLAVFRISPPNSA